MFQRGKIFLQSLTLFLMTSLLILHLCHRWLLTSMKEPVIFKSDSKLWYARLSRELIFPNITSTILSPEVCDPKHGKPPLLLVIVCSAVKNTEARSAIRQTWANISELPRNVKVVFIIGQADNEKQQLKIKGESDEYGDIIQESFVDTYQNLTIKSLMLLKWFEQNCHQTQYVMKSDDDMYINLPKLNDLVKTNQDPYLLVGNLRRNVAPIRRSQSKWHVPYHMFPERHYPNYLVGTGYVMSRMTASKLYEASLDEQPFILEDVFITGLLSVKVNIRPRDNNGFMFFRRGYKVCNHHQIITSTKIQPKKMREIHNLLSFSKQLDCPEN